MKYAIKISIPPSVRMIASSAPALNFQQITTWEAIYQGRFSPEDLRHMIMRKAASELSQRLVDDIIKKSKIEVTEEANGLATRVSVVSMTYDDLVELLYRAYRDGQTERQDMTAQWVKS